MRGVLAGAILRASAKSRKYSTSEFFFLVVLSFVMLTQGPKGIETVVAVLRAWEAWVGVSALSVTGMLPKLGPGRALSLAVRSWVFFRPETQSVRWEDRESLRGLLVQVDQNKQAYIEV